MCVLFPRKHFPSFLLSGLFPQSKHTLNVSNKKWNKYNFKIIKRKKDLVVSELDINPLQFIYTKTKREQKQGRRSNSDLNNLEEKINVQDLKYDQEGLFSSKVSLLNLNFTNLMQNKNKMKMSHILQNFGYRTTYLLQNSRQYRFLLDAKSKSSFWRR